MSAPVQRPDLYVVARILDRLARADQPLKPTQLQLASGMNYTQFERYLDWLIARELVLVRPTEDGRSIEISAKGAEALRFLAHGIRELLREEFEKDRSRTGR